ncbi:ribosome assembly factor SBDS [archaeon]|jgi:ribosome maturation protein SDO1|nr:ribosome assembly factor SBDS [archaeon]
MTDTIARIKQGGKIFEIKADLEDALKLKKGDLSYIDVQGDRIFTNVNRGDVASTADLEIAFGTTDLQEIVLKIIKNGEIQTTQEHRDAEQEKKFNQVVDFLSNNAIDPQTKNPISTERLKSALNQSRINIKNTSVENQINDILAEISKIIPIKIETKSVKITVPAIYTGKVYGLVNQYKETEKWLDDGSLEVKVDVPAGIIIDFYDKLNGATQGAAMTEEIKK